VAEREGGLSRRARLEVALGSLTSLKIIAAMHRYGQPVTKYRIAVDTGIKPESVKRALEKLVQAGFVKTYPYTPRKYSLNRGDELLEKLLECLANLGYIDHEGAPAWRER